CIAFKLSKLRPAQAGQIQKGEASSGSAFCCLGEREQKVLRDSGRSLV
ncbi:hypothetical protein QBD00_003999, partial [Ochrobactrum sp. AN78]|nr:hypothetical protein [Ochrobactrum sp. AN78]